MPRRYTSRIINNPADTVHMQPVLQLKPSAFFHFPPEWQEWFVTHPELLHSSGTSLSVEVIRDMLYDNYSQFKTG